MTHPYHFLSTPDVIQVPVLVSAPVFLWLEWNSGRTSPRTVHLVFAFCVPHEHSSVPSHRLTWNCTDFCGKTTFRLIRGALRTSVLGAGRVYCFTRAFPRPFVKLAWWKNRLLLTGRFVGLCFCRVNSGFPTWSSFFPGFSGFLFGFLKDKEHWRRFVHGPSDVPFIL